MEKSDKKGIKKSVAEPKAGQGKRSLQNWQRLATARRELASNESARAELRSDPQSYLRQFGIQGLVPENAQLSDIEQQLMASHEFISHRDLRQSARRGLAAAVVVAGIALAVAANAAAAANVAAAVNGAVAANAAANANYAVNWNWGIGNYESSDKDGQDPDWWS